MLYLTLVRSKMLPVLTQNCAQKEQTILKMVKFAPGCEILISQPAQIVNVL